MYIPPLGVKENLIKTGRMLSCIRHRYKRAMMKSALQVPFSVTAFFSPLIKPEFPEAGSTVFFNFSLCTLRKMAAGASLVLTAAKNCRNASGVTAAIPISAKT